MDIKILQSLFLFVMMEQLPDVEITYMYGTLQYNRNYTRKLTHTHRGGSSVVCTPSTLNNYINIHILVNSAHPNFIVLHLRPRDLF